MSNVKNKVEYANDSAVALYNRAISRKDLMFRLSEHVCVQNLTKCSFARHINVDNWPYPHHNDGISGATVFANMCRLAKTILDPLYENKLPVRIVAGYISVPIYKAMRRDTDVHNSGCAVDLHFGEPDKLSKVPYIFRELGIIDFQSLAIGEHDPLWSNTPWIHVSISQLPFSETNIEPTRRVFVKTEKGFKPWVD